MNSRIRKKIPLLFLCVLLSAARPLPADDTPGRSEDLVRSSEFVQKKLDELLAAMSDVARMMEKTDPAVAKILWQTVSLAQREDISGQVEEVTKLLRKGLDEAAQTGQAQVIEDLSQMLRILEGAMSDQSETDRRLQQLQAMRNRIETLLGRQTREERNTRAAAFAKALDAEMQKLRNSLDDVIRRQQACREETDGLGAPDKDLQSLHGSLSPIRRLSQAQRLLNETAGEADLARLPVLAEAQRKLLQEARQAADKLSKSAPTAAEKVLAAIAQMQRSADALGVSSQARAQSPQEQALKDLHAAEKTLQDAMRKLLAGKPSGTVADRQGKLAQDTTALAGALRDAAKKAGIDPQTLPKPIADLKQAASHMDRATDSLNGQDFPDARKEQDLALAELKNEQARAKELHRRILEAARQKLDPAEQKDIADKTGQAAKDMAGDGKEMSGRSSVQQAAKCAGGAADAMSRNDAPSANPRQGQAAENLRAALDRLDEEIARLEQRQQTEKLATIEERLEDILNRQKACTKQTRDVYAARAKSEPLYDRPAAQKLTELAAVEGDLAENTASVCTLLKKEGTTVVFPEVLGDVQKDLAGVQKRLTALDPGPITQATQDDIERTLQELLEAVRKELSKGPGRGAGGGGGGCCGGKSPLVPPVAELRMLRLKQLRVNQATRRLDQMLTAGQIQASAAGDEYKRLAERQQRVVHLLQEIRQKLQAGPSNPEPSPREGERNP
jgi:hypothetical protein